MATPILPLKPFTNFRIQAKRRDLDLKLVAIDGVPFVSVESIAKVAYTQSLNVTEYVKQLGYEVLRIRTRRQSYTGEKYVEIISYDAALEFLAAGPLKPGYTKNDTSASVNLYFEVLSSPVYYRKVYYRLNLPLPNKDLPKPQTTAAGYLCVNGHCFKPIERARFEC